MVVNNSRARFNSTNQDASHWSFVYLLSQMKPAGMDMVQFIESWLGQWTTNMRINTFDVAARPNIQRVLDAWPKDGNGKIDLNRAPVRLLSIVFRTDLRVTNQVAGEGRFLYGVLDTNGNPLPFTIIIEYALPITAQLSQNAWYRKILDLKEHQGFNEAYFIELQSLTDLFTENRAARVSQPNFYVRLRTNEIALADPWEMRHFFLTDRGLIQQSLAQTPDMIFNGQRRDELIAWINQNRAQIRQNNFAIPESFLAGAIPVTQGFRWLAGQNVEEDLRSTVSINTCNGCHSGDTGTVFTHVNPRPLNEVTKISAFLTSELRKREADFRAQVAHMCQ